MLRAKRANKKHVAEGTASPVRTLRGNAPAPMPGRTYWVYVLASRSRVLYVGFTSDLARRVAEHRTHHYPGAFTGRYRVARLVYAEPYPTASEAFRRERQLKGWRRSRKVALVEAANPGWHDLLPSSPS